MNRLLAIIEETPEGKTDAAAIRDIAAELYDYAKGIKTLGQYYATLANAVDCRLQGKIELACRFEKTCERIYKDLPESLRW